MSEVNASAAPEIPVEVSTVAPLIVAKDEPAVEAPAEPVVEASTPEPEGDQKKGPKTLPEWAQKRLADATFEAREEARKRKALEDELARLRAASAPPSAPNAADTQAATNNAPAGGYKTQAEFDAAVQAEANRRMAVEAAARQEQEFVGRLDSVWASGLEKYKDDFRSVAENLQAVGFSPYRDPQSGQIVNGDLMQMVMEMDDPAQVLFDLGSDPNKARQIMELPPNKRMVALAKLGVTANSPKEAPPVSRAPRPIAPVEGSARPTSDPQDSDSDEEWFRKRNEQKRRRYS